MPSEITPGISLERLRQNRNSEDLESLESQQGFAPYTAHLFPQGGARDRTSRSHPGDDDNFDASAVDQLLPSQATSTSASTLTPNDEHQRLPNGKIEEQVFSASPVDGSASTPARCRRTNTFSAIGQAALDLCITGTSVYFLGFAFLTLTNKGKSESSSTVQNLLTAARFGPTIWPIMFSAIVGRFLTSVATWRLEHGIDVASVEYLIGSRTVFGALNTPFRMRILHYALPLLVILWTLSPLGGQASLRVVSLHPVFSNETIDVSYLESLSPSFPDAGDNAITKLFGGTINAVFMGALFAPASIRQSNQDLYGNLKIPLLQDLSTRSHHPDEGGWYSIVSGDHLEYSSLIGLPTFGIPASGRTFISIETSYLYPDCNCTMQDFSDHQTGLAWEEFREEKCNNGIQQDLAMEVDVDLHDHPGNASRVVTMATEPRRIIFQSGSYLYGKRGVTAACSLTTTYVEVHFICDGSVCAPTGMRRSKLPHITEAATWFDGLSAVGPSLNYSEVLCAKFVNSTGGGDYFHLSALSQYLANPDESLSGLNRMNVFGEDGAEDPSDAVFSTRFAQLLNTYWLASTSLFAVAGNFTNSSSFEGQGYVVDTTAELQTTETVLVYNTTWLIVLITGSLVMLAAGIATTALNLLRRGPDIMDSFTSMLRDTPYIHTDTGPSTEDASDKARRLRKMRVVLGDVRPDDAVGHVALGTQTDGESVRRLRSDRFYW